MSKEIVEHAQSIDQARLTATLLSLLTVQSYPGDERECADLYARQLEAAGMEVELDAAYSGSPSVIARLTGGPGPVLQFVGHLDTVPVEHPAPYLRNNIIFGRGSCDMKAGLAAFAETAAILASSRESLRGSLLITAYGQHEGSTTGTMHGPLRDLMRRGIRGDAVIVGDCTDGYAPTKGKGALIFDLTFSRNGTAEHELFGRQNVGHPLNAACRFVGAMTERSNSWPIKDAELGNETFFVGSLQGGEVYNTVPIAARVQGTRRYPAPRTFEQARRELEDVCAEIAAESGVDCNITCHRSGQPFEVDIDSNIMQCLQEAAESVYGHKLRTGPSLIATDLNHVVEVGQVPAVLWGVDGARAHATPEFVAIDNIIQVATVYLRAATSYLGGPWPK